MMGSIESSLENEETVRNLIVFSSRGEIEEIKSTLSSSGNYLNQLDKASGYTILHNAIVSHQEETVVFLLTYDGINVNSKSSKEGMTPLMLAARSGSVQVVRRLLDLKAKVHEIDEESNWTALHHASYQGSLEIVGMLLEIGAKVDATDSYGQTSLHVATACGHVAVADVLIKSGANLNLLDFDDCDAVSLSSSVEMAELLEAASRKQEYSLSAKNVIDVV